MKTNERASNLFIHPLQRTQNAKRSSKIFVGADITSKVVLRNIFEV